MIRGFEYLTNLAVCCPLPSPLPRGEGIGLSSLNIFRFTCHLIPNLALFDFQQLDSLSPWERVRERATNRKVRQKFKSPITHNNESPETLLPPRLLQKPNRVRTADSYLSPKRQACGLLTLSLALSHRERARAIESEHFQVYLPSDSQFYIL